MTLLAGLKSHVMHRKGQTALSFLVVVYSSLVVVSPVQAEEPTAAAPQLADGIWRIEGRAIPGTRCGDWAVRLTNRQGRLSGVVWFRRARVPMRDLVLRLDGSFSGTTRAGFIGSRFAHTHKITGQFAGDTVNLTLKTGRCPPRRGTASRQAAGSEPERDTATAMVRNRD